MASKIYIPANSFEDWQRYLARGDKQWKKDRSAYLLADCWQSAAD